MPRLKDKLHALREKHLLAAAEKILATKGCRHFRTAELAAEVGVGKGTIYGHYPSQASLVEAVLTQAAERLLSEIQIDPSANAPDRLRLAVSRIVERIASCPKDRLEYPCCLRQSPCPYEGDRRVCAALGDLVAESARQGAIQHDIEPALAAKSFQHLLSVAANHAFTGGDRARSMVSVSQLYLHGILGPES